jgi:diamine N-acetyltransferase
VIQGEKIVLRAPVDDDLPLLTELRNDVDAQRAAMALPRPNSRKRAEEWLAKRGSDPNTIFFIIAVRETNEGVGYNQITNIDWVHRHGDMGMAIGSSHRRKGYGEEAMHLMEHFVRDVFNLRKIVVWALADHPSQHMYERVGYDRIGVLRQHFYNRGAFHDVLLMEKLLG